MNTSDTISINDQIQSLLNTNKVEDLKHFLKRRHCLNTTNSILMYLFHIVQSAGILTTTLAAGYDMKNVIWIGAALNALAALIHVFEKTNESLITQYGKDIEMIQSNTYVDEQPIVTEDTSTSTKP